MALSGQLALDFTAPPPAQVQGPDVPYVALAGFVDRVRRAGISRLRQLKGLVDQAVTQETLVITDDDLPF
jgi:hypothetical protein